MTTRGSFTKKNKKKKNGGIGIGTSMVLVVFVLETTYLLLHFYAIRKNSYLCSWKNLKKLLSTNTNNTNVLRLVLILNS